MTFEKFIKKTIGLVDIEKEEKINALNRLLPKLENRKIEILKVDLRNMDEKQLLEYEEEKRIVVYQIKKGRKILKKLEKEEEA